VSTQNHKIAVIIPYFGCWPNYFNIFLKGCKHNDWLDILFFTDCHLPQEKPKNVTFIKATLHEISLLATKKLVIDITIASPYKLCDFRPCYGVIFEDYLKDHDYWGYGDIDLVYGDLKPFIVNRIAEGFDVLSNRSEILSGSLAFFKNTNFIKNLYAQSSLLIDQLTAPDYKGLDETAHNHTTWQEGDKLDLPPHCFTYLIANEDKKGTIRASFLSTCKEQIEGSEIIHYQNGLVSFEETSLAYYHYVCNKNRYEYRLPNWHDVPTSFFITATGFYKTDKFYRFINNYRKISGFISNILIRIWKRLTKN